MSADRKMKRAQSDEPKQRRTGEAHLRIGGPSIHATGVVAAVTRYVKRHPGAIAAAIALAVAAAVVGLWHPLLALALGIVAIIVGIFFPMSTRYTRIG
jgi:Flp pilus assembly protein TadB